MLLLPNSFHLRVRLDGADVLTPAEAYQPPAFRVAGPLGADINVRGGGMDSNCRLPLPPAPGILSVTLQDGRNATFTPRIGDGQGGVLGVLDIK